MSVWFLFIAEWIILIVMVVLAEFGVNKRLHR